MQVELIGCTSSGKSTLVRRLQRTGVELGRDVTTSDELMLRRVGLGWLRSRVARTLAVDCLALAACLLTLPRHLRYHLFALGVCRRSSGSLLGRLNLARNAIRKIGVFEFVRWTCRRNETVVVDEGTLHAAHNLLVDLGGTPAPGDYERFVSLVSLPDLVVYLTTDEETIVARLRERDHRRVRGATPSQLRDFVRRAVAVFERLKNESLLRDRLLVANASTGRVEGPAGDVESPIGQFRSLLEAAFTEGELVSCR